MTVASELRRLVRDTARYGGGYLRGRYWEKRQLRRYGPFAFSRSPPEIHILTSHRDATDAEWALASWWAASGARGDVILHDDGTLTRPDVARLGALFPGVTVIRRDEADRAVAPMLSGLPLCAAYRSRHPLALKLFDCALLGSAPSFTLMDSDLLFLGAIGDTFEVARRRWGERVNIFMKDYQPSYSLSQDQMARILGRPFETCINTGLALIRRDTVDVSKVEAYLREWPMLMANLSWTEQTLYALLTEGEAGVLDQSCQVATGRGAAGVVAKHYVGPVRGLFYAEGLELVRTRLACVAGRGATR